MLDYLGRDISGNDPRFRVLDAIGGNYPPTFLATACHDFLREHALPMYELLTAKGIQAVLQCYGSEDDPAVAHVFHVNIRLPDAIRCNDDECSFFVKFRSRGHTSKDRGDEGSFFVDTGAIHR